MERKLLIGKGDSGELDIESPSSDSYFFITRVAEAMWVAFDCTTTE